MTRFGGDQCEIIIYYMFISSFMCYRDLYMFQTLYTKISDIKISWSISPYEGGIPFWLDPCLSIGSRLDISQIPYHKPWAIFHAVTIPSSGMPYLEVPEVSMRGLHHLSDLTNIHVMIPIVHVSIPRKLGLESE